MNRIRNSVYTQEETLSRENHTVTVLYLHSYEKKSI